VHGALEGQYAIPVGGATVSPTVAPEYLTDGYGSSLTTSAGASGNYLSTGVGTITITFATPQTSLVLLWGSVDTYNTLTLNDGYSLTGTDVATQAGFLADGTQGVGGSTYVRITPSTPFTSATFTSTMNSFEFAGVAASTTPEPSGMVLMGTIVIAIGFVAVRRRRITKAATLGQS